MSGQTKGDQSGRGSCYLFGVTARHMRMRWVLAALTVRLTRLDANYNLRDVV